MKAFGFGLGLWPRGAGAGFQSESLFANGEVGALYDFSRADLLYHVNGYTKRPAEIDDAVFIAFEKSAFAGALLSEIVAAATPVAVSSWSNDAGNPFDTFSSSGDEFDATKSSAGGADYADSNAAFPTVVGEVYEMSFDVDSVVSLTDARCHFSTEAGNLGRSTALQFTTPLVGTLKGFVVGTLIGGTHRFIVFVLQTGTISVTGASVKTIAGNHGHQVTTANRPLRKDGFILFDGTNDSLLTKLVPGTVGSLFAKVAVPETVSALQVIAGGTVGTSRCFIGINTSGFACAGIGTDAETVIVDDEDLRGTIATIGVTWDANEVVLYVNGLAVYVGARAGSIGTNPLRLGASNNGGTAANFFSSEMYHFFARDVVTPPEIVSQWHTSLGPP